MNTQTKTLLAWTFVGLFAAALHFLVPAFGDEPYFVSWGLDPSLGYYDHPPLIGWLSWGLNVLETMAGRAVHGELHRLTYIAFGVATWTLLAGFMRRRFNDAPGPVLLAFAALPATLVLFGVYFNDTLMGLGVLVFLIATDVALRAERIRWDMLALAGLGFGAALLTKYIAGLAYIAMVLYLLSSADRRRFLFGPFLVTTLIAGAIFAPNILWNLQNCNVNLAFNFAFRQMQAHPRGLLLFALQITVILGPALFFLGRALYRQWRGPGLGYYASLFVLIFALTALIALTRGTYRMNWGLPYILFAVMAGAEVLNRAEVGRLVRWNLGFLVVFALPFLTIFTMDRAGLHPLDNLAPPKDVALFTLDMDLADGNLIAALEPFAAGKVLATANYGQTALLRNHGFEAVDFPIVAELQVFGRNFDLFTDYAALEGRDVVFVVPQLEAGLIFARKIFDRVEVVEITAKRTTHHVILGFGFRYESYRQQMILPAMARFYDAHPFYARACYMDRFRSPL